MFKILKAIKDHIAVTKREIRIQAEETEYKAKQRTKQLQQEFQQQHGVSIEEFQKLTRNP